MGIKGIILIFLVVVIVAFVFRNDIYKILKKYLKK